MQAVDNLKSVGKNLCKNQYSPKILFTFFSKEIHKTTKPLKINQQEN